MKDNKFRFGQVLRNVQQMKKELPVILAVKTQNQFVKNFTDGGFEGQPWKEPKRRVEGTKQYRYSKFRDKPILVNRGILRSKVASSIRSKTWQLIQLVVDSVYGKRHNEGLDGMAKRQYMGDGANLRLMHKTEIKKYMNKLWQR